MGYDTATHEMTSRRVFPAVTLTLLALLASMGPVPVAGQAPDSRPRLPRPSGPPPGMLNPPKPPKAVAPGVRTPPPSAPSRVEKLGESALRIGSVHVDLVRRELTVPGIVNDVMVLEYLVNTRGGYKSYESAIEAECNALDFNLALVLIGLDEARSVARPRFHFDPLPPQGDAVEMFVSWRTPIGERRVKPEELVYDEGVKQTLPAGHWVYTGPRFVSNSKALLADVEGVLIGFVHTPATLIERVEPVPGPYGNVKLNPALGLTPGTPVLVTVRALPRPGK
jgi:hypothetical protein